MPFSVFRNLRMSGALGVVGFVALAMATPALAQPKPAPKPAAPAPAAPAPAAPAPAAGAAPAGGTPESGLVQLKPEPSQPDWVKVCGKDPQSNVEICYTTRDFVSDQGQPVLAVAMYDVKGKPEKPTRFILPLGLLLAPGVKFAVDQGPASDGKFVICLPNGCFAEGVTNDAFIGGMKKGTTLNVKFKNQVGNEVTFQVPLAGFGKAFDGAPLDPKVVEEQQKKLQEELQKRSDELRAKLGGAAAATPDPAAPKP
ncbi:Invasion protein IalB, involved in pathogenesis [Rhizobiales bacterium GAS191]|jgi:invasion protein IalB|nr:Invasion protein IalB, involved in pathogenesis [Rhizobiales bacterium GAS113]SEE10094.1 Invasion protein IalB, involved in pathogenesis [Rhizobiales bacterium GAS191]SEE44338.1 Invasion protein IalB, involved in pathogenesis [Rhizobiales bacterium GAS188]